MTVSAAESTEATSETGWQPAGKLEHKLLSLLEAPFTPGPQDEKSEWLEPIAAWLSRRGPVLLPPEARLSPNSPAARLWLFVRVLQGRPATAARLAAVLRALVEETTAVHLFCDAGMGGRGSFAGETLARISLKLIPAAPNDRQLDEVVSLLFPDKRAARFIAMLPDQLLEQLWQILFSSRPPWHLLRNDMADAVIVLAGRVAAHGLENDVRIRSGPAALRESPFFSLVKLCSEPAELSRTTSDREIAKQPLSTVYRCIDDGRVLLLRAIDHQEENGVSVDLVHRIERMGKQLTRIQLLLRMLFPEPAEGAGQGKRLFSLLVSQQSDDRSLRSLVQANVRQLSRKIIESASATGEHYIAQTRAEYRVLLGSAAGAGLITALTTLLKYRLGDLSLPPFFLGLLSSLNYAISFLVIYFLGWTLATKQPAATAATLAHSMRTLSSDEDRARMVEQIARTTRSQLAAIAGNLATVIPGAVALDLLWRASTGRHFFDLQQAEHAFHSLQPIRSLLVLYAALTGLLLWLSSIAAGWVTNWSTYRRLPEALARSRTLLRLAGAERRARFTAFFTRNVGGIAGNVALGFLLGMAPVLGAFFGLPTEIRHVTLSTGLLTFAASAHGTSGVAQAGFFWGALGIAVIGIFNFAVSFSLALWLASRACGLEREALTSLRRAVLREFLRNPGRFLLPPREDEPAAAAVAPSA